MQSFTTMMMNFKWKSFFRDTSCYFALFFSFDKNYLDKNLSARERVYFDFNEGNDGSDNIYIKIGGILNKNESKKESNIF